MPFYSPSVFLWAVCIGFGLISVGSSTAVGRTPKYHDWLLLGDGRDDTAVRSWLGSPVGTFRLFWCVRQQVETRPNGDEYLVRVYNKMDTMVAEPLTAKKILAPDRM